MSPFDVEPGPFAVTEQGIWCPSCGDIVIPDFHLADLDEWEPPEGCQRCGFPDDAEQMAEYHCGDWE